MNYIYYTILGLAPSLIWLFFYLRKDVHPEPKGKVVKIFLWGGAAAMAAVGLEMLLLASAAKLPLSKFVWRIFYFSFGIAIIEEILKYLVVRINIFKDPVFEEALDAIEYMIIAALGFAALENIFLFFSAGLQFFETFVTSCLRFVGATLLHTLCSGIVGFFIAIGPFRKYLIFVGLAIAIILHTLYDFSIMGTKGEEKFLFQFIILLPSTIFVLWAFRKLRRS
jgi:RsiW-degrading membrane proteinase PrsW (M82 family)